MERDIFELYSHYLRWPVSTKMFKKYVKNLKIRKINLKIRKINFQCVK